ncbi:MAG TPA: SLC13 family permease, partial [Nitrospirota bacterium]|nr:SLC13 family permease [Nitrospirota bacterium]
YSLVAASGAVALLLFGRIRTETILEGVDWTLLLFFSGLFVVMHGVEASGLAAAVIAKAGDLTSLSSFWQIAGLSTVSVVLSNLVSNVPAVMLLKSLTQSLGNGHVAWLALAMSSTLAGNLTLIGSVANLIVAQQAARRVEIGFIEYFRVGALITLVTVAVGVLVLFVEVRMAHGAEANAAKSGLSLKTVAITPVDSASATREYRIVLLCDTDASRERGLQGFRPLKRDEAALFVFQKPVAVTFWMGSVAYPIDIIFVGPDRKVVRVYPNCRPRSPEYYPSTAPVSWVIETAAGSGIRSGDRVSFK